eukprot:4892386-Amphidinium_carterae.1
MASMAQDLNGLEQKGKTQVKRKTATAATRPSAHNPRQAWRPQGKLSCMQVKLIQVWSRLARTVVSPEQQGLELQEQGQHVQSCARPAKSQASKNPKQTMGSSNTQSSMQAKRIQGKHSVVTLAWSHSGW